MTRDGPEVGASLDGESLSGDGALGLQARVQVRVVEGTGVVLSGDGAPFVDARIEEATGPEVAELSRPKRDTTELVIGTVLAGGTTSCPRGSMPAASTGTRSSAGSRAPARRTRSASCSSSSCSTRSCASS